MPRRSVLRLHEKIIRFQQEETMVATPQNTTIGFIGTGVMGKSMAGHLQKAGYPLHVYTRTKEKAQGLIDNGAVWHDSPGDVAGKCRVIITIVGFPSDVEEVYRGENGILANVKE